MSVLRTNGPLVYFTSITQKADGTYNHVLKGADADVMLSNVVEEPVENHRPWTGDTLEERPLLSHALKCLDPDLNTDSRCGRGVIHDAVQTHNCTRVVEHSPFDHNVCIAHEREVIQIWCTDLPFLTHI